MVCVHMGTSRWRWRWRVRQWQQVCLDYGIPFAAVRTISDRADNTAHIDFPKFVQEVASVYTQGIVMALLCAVGSVHLSVEIIF